MSNLKEYFGQESKKNIELVCPHCYEENKVSLLNDIKCNSCNKSLMETTYTKQVKSFFLGTVMTLSVAGGVGYYLASDDRYPIDKEYLLVDSCISSNGRVTNSDVILSIRNQCVCSLENSMKEYSYDDYKEDEMQFLDIFAKESQECGKKLSTHS